MLDFLKFIIPILFIISLISLKISPQENKTYSRIKVFFNILALIFIILISIYMLKLIIEIVFSICINSILEVIYGFLLGFGF